jgi:hypothetical protein
MRKKIAFILIIMASTTLLLLGLVNAKGSGTQKIESSIETPTVFIQTIDEINGITSLKADDILWYEGEEANQQFRIHESDAEIQEAPDGYYIVNDSPKLRTLEIAQDAIILMQIYDRQGNNKAPDIIPNESISLQKFISLFDQKDGYGLNMQDYPFHLTIENGKVVKIVQQFIS